LHGQRDAAKPDRARQRADAVVERSSAAVGVDDPSGRRERKALDAFGRWPGEVAANGERSGICHGVPF